MDIQAFPPNRRGFVGGSDAKIIMGDDHAALLRLWQEKRGELEPQDLAHDLLVQATEPLNRHWYEKQTGQRVRGAAADLSSGSPLDGRHARRPD